jgi:hypothetical protein
MTMNAVAYILTATISPQPFINVPSTGIVVCTRINVTENIVIDALEGVV